MNANQLAEQIKSLELLQHAQQTTVKNLFADLQHPRLLNETIESLTQQIEALQTKLTAAKHRLENCKELYVAATEQLDDTNRKLAKLRNFDKLEKVKALQQQIKELSGESGVEKAIAALHTIATLHKSAE